MSCPPSAFGAPPWEGGAAGGPAEPDPRRPLEWAGDLAVAAAVAGGDVRAFELLMRRHNRRLFRLARATLRDDAEAEDALQDAYLAAYRAIGRFRGEATLATWLSRLVLNECLARRRRQLRRDNIVPMHGHFDEAEGRTQEGLAMDDERRRADAPEQQLARAELRALIERRLDELPADFRLVFVLRSVEELSVEDTALSLDIPEATVRSRHFRARSLLREALAQDIDLAERDVFTFGGAHCDRIVQRVLQRLASSA
jgi:RNA polymerase sigma-70 factor (ECF subfamily)